MKNLSLIFLGLLAASVALANSTGTGDSGANGTNGMSTTGSRGVAGTKDAGQNSSLISSSSSSSQSSAKQLAKPTRDSGSTNAAGDVVTGNKTRNTVSDTVSKNKVGKDE